MGCTRLALLCSVLELHHTLIKRKETSKEFCLAGCVCATSWIFPMRVERRLTGPPNSFTPIPHWSYIISIDSWQRPSLAHGSPWD